MSDGVTYRWIGGVDSEHGPAATKEEWDRIEGILVVRNWMSLNRPTSQVLLAEDAEGQLLGFMVLQLVPHPEPLFVIPSQRASGIAEELADRMLTFMVSIQTRGWMVVADNPAAAKLCEARGMTKLDCPVYVAK